MRAESFAQSLRCALAGLSHAIQTQRNVRIQLAIAASVGLAALACRLSVVEISVLILTTLLVLVAELFNTALEATVDLASPEIQPLARVAKDVAAGAVLLAACGAIGIGALIFAPHLLTLLAD